MRRRSRWSAGLLLGCALGGCSAKEGELLVSISSKLQIPTDANTLVVRVHEAAADGGKDNERSYTLGEPPQDKWPQVVPIIAHTGPRRIDVIVELRLTQSGAPSRVVGYGGATAELPRSGSEELALTVPSVDGGIDLPDGGVGVDAGPPDSGVPDTCADFGVICAPEDTCFAGKCHPRCSSQNDCPGLAYTCFVGVSACICNTPCVSGSCPSAGESCINDCCQ